MTRLLCWFARSPSPEIYQILFLAILHLLLPLLCQEAERMGKEAEAGGVEEEGATTTTRTVFGNWMGNFLT
jgi:hypothetical protein